MHDNSLYIIVVSVIQTLMYFDVCSIVSVRQEVQHVIFVSAGRQRSARTSASENAIIVAVERELGEGRAIPHEN